MPSISRNSGTYIYTILFSLICGCVYSVHGINRDGSGIKASAANLTNAFNTPYAFYDYERDPRQWLGTPYGATLPPLSGGLEAIAIGLLIALGLGIIGFPLVILLFSLFLGNTGSFNFVPPATTTTVTGRKRREAMEQLFPQINSQLHSKIISLYEQFSSAPDKMAYLKKFLGP
ncbi:uncharacterized protein LOC141854977 [Brevipalpus obovatus]|uniref:uncharacterized protein LOC141854977 n=1 Tax=Brevipalpus obovatus TaxID=246614 RepID=UPI003D9E59D7